MTDTNNSLAIFYSFRRCPYAMRARLAIAYSCIQVELREITLKNKPISMLQASPKGTVPVLIIGERVIDESIDIMFWALNQQDPQNWFYGLSEEQQNHIRELINLNDNHFKPILDKYKYASRFPDHTEAEYAQAALPFLSRLDTYLQHSKYLISDNLSLADMAILPFIRQFASVNPHRFKEFALDNLKQWMDRLLSAQLFLSVMQKYPEWQIGGDCQLFPDRV